MLVVNSRDISKDPPKMQFRRHLKCGTNVSKEYVIGKLLGQGSFGKVHECYHKITKQKYAFKIVNKSKIDLPVY